MDAIIIGRVREFLDVYRSGDLKLALKCLSELSNFIEGVLNVTRDKTALTLALNVYMTLPIYRDMISLKMKIEEIEKKFKR